MVVCLTYNKSLARDFSLFHWLISANVELTLLKVRHITHILALLPLPVIDIKAPLWLTQSAFYEIIGSIIEYPLSAVKCVNARTPTVFHGAPSRYLFEFVMNEK